MLTSFSRRSPFHDWAGGPNETPGLYDFEWDCQPGKVYDLLTSTDLATPISTWPVYDPDSLGEDTPYANIPAIGTPVDTSSPEASSGWTTLGPFDLAAGDNTNIYLEFRYAGTDAANGLTFDVLAGSPHAASPTIAKLTDGPAQTNSDHLAESWLTTDDFVGARIQVDLLSTISIAQINTYSWHANTRAPQIYNVYGALSPSNAASDFGDAGFQDSTALGTLGYTLIATVSTPILSGGQVGVSIDGDIGT